jgi:CBS domain-containing protein
VATLVRDLMHEGVVKCEPDYPLGKVAKLLAEHHVHSLFIFNSEQLPVGVITDYDVMAGEWLSGDPESLAVLRTMTAKELMSSPVEMVDIETPASEAAARMLKDSIRRLLVVERDHPVGVISVSDFISDIASKTSLRREYVSDVMSDAYLVCRDKTPVTAAARAMKESGWRSVVVVDPHGKPLGVFSGLDLLAHSEMERIPDKILVTDVMHEPLFIDMDATLQEAAQLMIDNHHHRILVIDPTHIDSMPLGVISSFDIVSEMARPDSVWQQG